MPQTCLVPLHLSCHHALDFSLGLHDSVNLHMQIAWSVVKQHTALTCAIPKLQCLCKLKRIYFSLCNCRWQPEAKCLSISVRIACCKNGLKADSQQWHAISQHSKHRYLAPHNVDAYSGSISTGTRLLGDNYLDTFLWAAPSSV